MGFIKLTSLQLVLLAALSVTTAPRTFARDVNAVPGRMGPNALPTLPVEDAAVGDDVLVEIAGTTQFDDLKGSDTAFAPYFRIMIPFRQLAAIEFDGTPVEFWSTNPEVQQSRDALHSNGVAKGDIRFGGKFYVVRETENIPAFAVRFLTKTTTGKSYEDKRFTDAPGYMLDLLTAKTIFESPGFIKRLRLMAQLGFMAWQQGEAAQDDAVSFGTAVQAVFENGLQLETQLRGYVGWEHNDKPVVAGITASYPFQFFRVLLTLNRGITRDAPNWEIRAGLEFFFEIPYLKRRLVTR